MSVSVSVSQISSSGNDNPPWEVLLLVAHLLDPKTLAIASCVSKSWFHSMSSDCVWQPICSNHYPSLSNFKSADPCVPYRRLFAAGLTATARRLEPPSEPRISLNDLIFAVDLRTKDRLPLLTVAKPVDQLPFNDSNGIFRFDIAVDDRVRRVRNSNGLMEDVKMTWNMVLRGWKRVFTMMECEGRVGFASGVEGWFSEELPSPPCCCAEVGSGMVADLKMRLSGNGVEEVWVERVRLGILSVVNWRYVSVDDGLRYLQHFLLFHDSHV